MKSSNASYNQIVIFQCIAKEGSIRGTARKLEMAAPSVSQSLKLLESKLGIPLFRRSTRQMSLTEAGKFLLENTSDAIATLDYALESVSDLSHAPSGHVSITVPRFVYRNILKPIIPKFCETYPDIQLEISVSDSAVNIIKEEIDIGIRFGNLIEDGVVAHKLTEPAREALFASPAYIKKYGMPKSAQDLKKHKAIRYRFGASNRLAPLLLNVDKDTLTVEMPHSMIVNDTDIMIDSTLADLGIGRMITPLVDKYFARGELLPILEKSWVEYDGLYIYFSQHSQKARRVRVLIDFLLENAKYI